MVKVRVYVVEPTQGIVDFFNKNPYFEACSISSKIREERLPKPDLICFTGGSDVSPMLYNQKNTASMNDLQRDISETLLYHRFFDVKKVGICRGGQFLNVMNGGSMLQDIPNHAISGTHLITGVDTGREYEVTSTHHQGMVLSPRANLVAYNEEDKIPEVAYYQASSSLCFQPHPEYGVASCERLFFTYIRSYFEFGGRV